MKIIQQPENSSLCGQCVVAMLAGQPLEDMLGLMGEGRNYPRDLRKAFKFLGIDMATRSKMFPEGAANNIAAVFLEVDKWRHWVAWFGAKWYDPRDGAILSTDDFSLRYPIGRVKMYYLNYSNDFKVDKNIWQSHLHNLTGSPGV